MKISTRFSWLAFTTALLSGIALIAVLLWWEFSTRKALWAASLEMAIASNTAWPSYLHFKNDDAAGRELTFLSNRLEGLTFAAAYHIDGSAIVSLPADADSLPRPDRDQEDKLDIKEGFLDVSEPAVNAFVVSMPIMTPVNPMDNTVSWESYRQQMAGADVGARFAAGYVEAGISIGQLASSMASTAATIVACVAAALLFALLIIRAAARTISKPLERIAQVAHQISQDDLPRNVRLSITRDDEIGEIAMVLNGVIEGVHKMKAQMDVDKALMSMKVDSTSKKLDEAEEQVNKTREEVKRVAYYDPVTHLPNRRLMLEQLALLIQIAAREKKHIAVLLVDLHNLRRINESLGRESGDAVLRELGSRLVDTLRHSDVISHDEAPREVARVGNDEFCLVLHGVSSTEDAMIAAKRILNELKRPMMVGEQDLRLDFFMGFSMAPSHGKHPEALIHAADVALNHAHNEGSSEPVCYDPGMDAAASERFQLEVDLKNAALDREMQLHYQPQIDTETGEVVGAEALVRWQHPTRGTIPPFRFIPVAESSGFIVELGRWILHRACKDLVRLREQGIEIPKVSVNISALQLTTDFVDEVRGALAMNHLEPRQLELELTESLLVQDVDAVMAKLQVLHQEVGVRLSVDDFGTGYSSLAYLSRFPLDELKVDRSFVMAMEEDDNAAKITKAIIAIGRELDLEIVVEGVDSPAQYHHLRELGASVIQGYLFSKPLPFEECATFIANRGFAEVLDKLKS